MNALANAGKETVKAVLATPEAELHRIRNLGRVGREQIGRLRIALHGRNCPVTATIDATTRRCGNDRGHLGDCWFLSKPDTPAAPDTTRATPSSSPAGPTPCMACFDTGFANRWDGERYVKQACPFCAMAEAAAMLATLVMPVRAGSAPLTSANQLEEVRARLLGAAGRSDV